MGRLFGTDGLRAAAGEFPLDYSSAYALGKALASLLREEGFFPGIIVGKDTRESGDWLEQALCRGVKAEGGEIVSAGVIPTSAVAFLTKEFSFSAGIVISASHNPFEDNGIKIFSSRGIKISPEWEERLETALLAGEKISEKKIDLEPAAELVLAYSEFLKSRFSGIRISRKIKVVLDCSNGASSILAPGILSDLGFDVLAINASPDGKNINAGCGSLFPQDLTKKVLEIKADIGIAYDGDADRAIWVDEKGKILNGDHTLFILSRFMKPKGRLRSDHVVATTMSNLGLELALKKLELKLFRAQVGDKYVLEEMLRLGANLGGEQSGHTIFLDDFPTGDGILTSLRMLEVLAVENVPLGEMASEYQEFPQVLKNVRVKKKENFSQYPEIMEMLRMVEGELEGRGRLNLRYSGTEPLARIMIEGQDQQQIKRLAENLAAVIAKYLG